METKNQDRISELVEKQKDTYTSMADEIWGYAEPRFQEYGCLLYTSDAADD